MSQFDETEVEDTQHQEFDLNNAEFLAQLKEIVPDIDPDEIPRNSRPAPVPDGVYWVRLRLRGDKKEPVYFKNPRIDPDTGKAVADSVVAILTPRVLNHETGQEMGFLKDWYASSATPKVPPGAPPRGSAITAICKMAGKPIRRGADIVEIMEHVQQVFAEAGEGGVDVLVKTQWVKSVPKVQDIGGQLEYVFKANGQKDYEETRGEQKIKDLMAKAGVPEDMAHIWIEPKTGEERTVQAQVQQMEDPAKYERR